MTQSYGSSQINGDGAELLIEVHERGTGTLDEADQEFIEELWDRFNQGDGSFHVSTVEYMRLRVIWEQSL